MPNITYPLTGFEAEVAFGLETVMVFTALEMFLIFLYRYIKDRYKEQNIRNLAWSFIFLGFGLTYIFYIYADYINPFPEIRDIYSQYGYVCLTLGCTCYCFISDKIDKNKYYIYTIICLFFTTFMIYTIIIQNRKLGQLIAVVALPIVIFYAINYFRKLAKITKNNKLVMNKIRMLSLSIIIITIGYLLVSDYILELLGIWERIVSNILNIIGINLFMITIIKMPDYREFLWYKKIYAVFLVNDAGISMFSRFYKTIGQEGQDLLISSAIITIKNLLSTMTEIDQIGMIELEGKTLIFEANPDIGIACLISEEYIPSLKYKLLKFVKNFKELFGLTLKTWNGDVEAFLPAEPICDKIFGSVQKL